MSDLPLRFVLNDRVVDAGGAPATTTLLDWLRGPGRLRGTKEGCAEGDCGACTVLVEEADPSGRVRARAVNSCLMMVGQVAGLGVRTVEGAASGADLHPVQTCLATGGGTQCGFCTPGFVMSAVALLEDTPHPTDEDIHDALAGNLCRCTGYRPIVDAIRTAAEMPATRTADPSPLHAVAADAFDPVAAGTSFHQPRDLDALLALRARHPGALLLAGGTDLGLLASRERKPPACVIHVGQVRALREVQDVDGLVIGAAVTYRDAVPHLLRWFPGLAAYLGQLGSRQIRNAGTIGGNLGTASPVGDMLPLLFALGATVALRSLARGERRLPVEQFVTGYRRTALAPDEVIATIIIPHEAKSLAFFAEKVSRRRDQDIATLSIAAAYRLIVGRLSDVRIAFGGMGAAPARAIEAERLLEGCEPGPDIFAAAARTIATQFAPIDDHRATADYRRSAAANLLLRLQMQIDDSRQLLHLDQL